MNEHINFKRNIISYLVKWREEALVTPGSRKPLVVRGARQVGKTRAITLFGSTAFSDTVYLNLENSDNARLFDRVRSAREALSLIELQIGRSITPGKTLLFLDEIQEAPHALDQLRYFYEELPKLHVIAAGSLLDIMLQQRALSVPVGRIEFCYMHPLTFDEFLEATGRQTVVETLKGLELNKPVDPAVHEILLKEFFTYALVGGMPEAVATYAQSERASIVELDRIFESLFTAYRDDIGKYTSSKQALYLRHCLEHAPAAVGMQIAYRHFGESDFQSREISNAFDLLELAQLVTRVWSSRSLAIPIVPVRRKSPKLVFLDVGLVNYRLGQRHKIATFGQLENVFQGQITEQLVGQAIRAFGVAAEQPLNYWYRDRRGSVAEVDYLYTPQTELIAIEVKAQAVGHLRSLHSFIDTSGARRAVKVSSLPPSIKQVTTVNGNRFRLVSVPHYLVFRLNELLEQ